MAKVRFFYEDKHNMFTFNSKHELDNIPIIGDIITTSNIDFTNSTFRVKPFRKEKEYKSLKHIIKIDFIVSKRTFDLHSREWVIDCVPTIESLSFLLKRA